MHRADEQAIPETPPAAKPTMLQARPAHGRGRRAGSGKVVADGGTLSGADLLQQQAATLPNAPGGPKGVAAKDGEQLGLPLAKLFGAGGTPRLAPRLSSEGQRAGQNKQGNTIYRSNRVHEIGPVERVGTIPWSRASKMTGSLQPPRFAQRLGPKPVRLLIPDEFVLQVVELDLPIEE